MRLEITGNVITLHASNSDDAVQMERWIPAITLVRHDDGDLPMFRGVVQDWPLRNDNATIGPDALEDFEVDQ